MIRCWPTLMIPSLYCIHNVQAVVGPYLVLYLCTFTLLSLKMRKNVPQQVSVSPNSKFPIQWCSLTLLDSLCLSRDLAQHVFTKIQILMERRVLKSIKCAFSSQWTFFLLYKHALRSVCCWNLEPMGNCLMKARLSGTTMQRTVRGQA